MLDLGGLSAEEKAMRCVLACCTVPYGRSA